MSATLRLACGLWSCSSILLCSSVLDVCRKQEGMQMTIDIRKVLGEKARIERDKAIAKEEAARKALLEVSLLRLSHHCIASLTVSAIPVVEAQALLAL